MSTDKGVIYGLGLGPGDPDLMSVKADRILRKSSHVAYFRKKGRKGHARTIVDTLLAENVVEYAMEYPVTTEIALSDPAYNVALSEFYEGCAARIKTFSDQGISVTVLCEGDPFFYGSFMHIHPCERQPPRLRGPCDHRYVCSMDADGSPHYLGR